MTEIVAYGALPEQVRQAIDGGLTRTLCPKCSGGTHGEQSLTVRPLYDDVGIVKLSCWRSTCDWWALVPAAGATLQRRHVKTAEPYREDILPMSDPRSDDVLDVLLADYGLRFGEVSIHGWGTTKGTLVMPVRAPTGGVRGHVTRTFTTPKRCMTYKATAQPWLDHWPSSTRTAIVVVEDPISAARLNGLGFHAVALLGTNMSAEAAREIAEVAGELPVYLALDNDAFGKALHMSNKFSHIVPMRPVLLTEDIKNMADDASIRKLFPC